MKRVALKNLVTNVGMVASGAALGQVFVLLAYPFVSRFVSPEQFGEFGVFASVVAVVAVIASLKFDAVLPIVRSKVRAATVVFIALVSSSIISLLSCYLMLVLLGRGGWLAGDEIPNYAILSWIPVGIFASAVFLISGQLAVRQRNLEVIARGRAAQGFISASLQVVFSFLGYGAVGLAAAQVVSQSLSGIFISRRSAKSVLEKFSLKLHSKTILKVIFRYRNYCLLGVPSGLLNSLSLQAPTLAWAFLFDAERAGLYFFVLRVLGSPVAMLSQAASQYSCSEVSSKLRGRSRGVNRVLIDNAKNLLFLSIPVAIVVTFVSPHLFGFVFGEEWTSAGTVASMLVWLYITQLCTSPFSQVLLLLERQGWQLFVDLLRFIVLTGAFVYMYGADLSFNNSLFLFVMFGIAMYTIQALICWRVVFKSEESSCREIS